MRGLHGKRVALTALLVGLAAVLIASAIARRDLMAHYHLWRLGRAETREEARPWLEMLAKDLEKPGFSGRVVSTLGPGRVRLTFWIFQHLNEACVPLSDECLLPEKMGPLLPLIRDLGARIEKDEALLATWAHFHRWIGSSRWRAWNEFSDDPPPHVGEVLGKMVLKMMFFPIGLGSSLSPDVLSFARKDPAAWEALDRFVGLELIAEAWILGMSPLPRRIGFKGPETADDLEKDERARLDKNLRIWVMKHRQALRFDPGQGRCVPRREGEAFLPITVPLTPLPGWPGPPPPREPELPPPALSI